jgi:hypothetical protein
MRFPLSAIDHIEVLRDGAAAQYGSDAIAGVINIILKKARPAAMRMAVRNTRARRQAEKRAGSTGFNLGDDGWVRIAAKWPTATRPTAPAPTSAIRPSRAGKVNQRFGDPETKPRRCSSTASTASTTYRLVRLRQLRPARHLGRRHLAHGLQRHGAAHPIHRKASCRWRTAP